MRQYTNSTIYQMSFRKKSTDINPEFICEYPEETPDFYYGFDTGLRYSEDGSSYYESDKGFILLVNKTDITKTYKSQINVLKKDNDYWFRHSRHGKYIILSYFAGLTIFNNVLEKVFYIDPPTSTSDESVDVWGYELNDNVLLYWSVNSVKKIADEYNDKMRDLRSQNILESTSNKQRKRANNAIRYMHSNSSSYNIPDELLYKTTLQINPMDLIDKVILPTPQHYVYIFINTSLKMNNGKIASQVSHLSRTMTLAIFQQGADSDLTKRYNDWIATGSEIIILKASELEIRKLASRPDSCAIVDEGHTQVEPDSLTVLGFFPSVLKPEFKSFKCESDIKKRSKHVSNIFQKSIHEICSVIDINQTNVPMYFVVDKTTDLTKHKLITEIFHVTMEITKELIKHSKDDIYFKTFTNWISNGAKTIVLKVDSEQISKIGNLEMSHKLFSNHNDISVLSVLAFLPYTIDMTVLSSYKLY